MREIISFKWRQELQLTLKKNVIIYDLPMGFNVDIHVHFTLWVTESIEKDKCQSDSDLTFAVLFIDMKEGEVGDMEKLGITESFQVKRQVLMSASEAAEMILRVDDIIKAAPRPRQPDHRHH